MLDYDEDIAARTVEAVLQPLAGVGTPQIAKLACLGLLAALSARYVMHADDHFDARELAESNRWRALARALDRAANTIAVRG